MFQNNFFFFFAVFIDNFFTYCTRYHVSGICPICFKKKKKKLQFENYIHRSKLVLLTTFEKVTVIRFTFFFLRSHFGPWKSGSLQHNTFTFKFSLKDPFFYIFESEIKFYCKRIYFAAGHLHRHLPRNISFLESSWRHFFQHPTLSEVVKILLVCILVLNIAWLAYIWSRIIKSDLKTTLTKK